MEVEPLPVYQTASPAVSTWYSSFSCRNYPAENRTSHSLSFLPRIITGQSRRTERYGSSSRIDKPKQKPKQKVIYASKHGYHPRGNSPTFKLLTEVSQKLQVMIDLQNNTRENQNNADSNCDDYLGDCSSSDEDEDIESSTSTSVSDGVLLRLEHSSVPCSPDTLTPSPVAHQRPRRSANTQLHLYLPRLTETTEKDDIPIPTEPTAHDTKRNNSSKTECQDYANFYSVRYGLEDRQERNCIDYKKSSTTYSKKISKSGSKKCKTKKHQKPCKSSAKMSTPSSESRSKSSTAVLPSIKNDTNNDQDKEVQTDYIDFLNDVPTLISEQRDKLQFLDCFYSLPDLGGTVDELWSQKVEPKDRVTVPTIPQRTSCQSISIDKPPVKPTSDCTVCRNNVGHTTKFVDRLYGNGVGVKEDLNNNNTKPC